MTLIDSQTGMRKPVDALRSQHDLTAAGYAAESGRQETPLGAGMVSITEKSIANDPAPIGPGSYSRQPRRSPTMKNIVDLTQKAQEEAEKTGGIVAVAEIPVDISESFSGGDFETRSMMASGTGPGGEEAHKSYFFPEGSFVLMSMQEGVLTSSRS
jgi:hypothetical protein